MKKVLSLDLKYSGIQMLYYGSFCALMGYASVYLLDKGFSNSMIGISLALVSVIAVFAQPSVASFADKNQHIELRKIIAVILAITVVLSASMFLFGKGSILLLIAFIGVSTFMQTITPLLNSMAFVFEKHGIEINFGLGRGLGSAAYALVSMGLGYLVEDVGASILPLVYLIMNILLIIITYTFVIPQDENKKESKEEKEEKEEQLSFINFAKRYKKIMIFIFGLVLVYFTHTIINNFFIQVITPIGGTESDMGTAVFLAAILELPAMIFFNNIREKISCTKLIMIAVIAFALKHTLTYFATNITIIYIAQALQMVSYAILTPASVYYANQIISQADLVKGQSMITMAYTASGIIANLAGGILLDILGVKQVLLLGIIVSILGVVIVMLGVNDKKTVNQQ